MATAEAVTQQVTLASGRPARAAWPLDPVYIHLNHGSFGAVPTEVVEFQHALYREADGNPVGWFPRIAERVQAAREEVAGFLRTPAENTVFVPNASGAATVVFNSLRLEPGDEILVTDHGYGAVIMGARRLAQRFGARLRTVDIPLAASAEEVLECFRLARTPRTRLILVDQITSPTARLLPTARIAAEAAEHGIRTLVDGAHAPGLIADPVQDAGGDWWFGNLHKWPCAPRGSAVLATSAPDRNDLWPLIDSWAADEPFPTRFDTQGTIDATSYIASPQAIRFIEREYGWERTRATMAELADTGARLIGDAFQPYVSAPALTDVAMPVPSMRLVRLPDGVGVTREDADQLRMDLFDETQVETAFTSFRGIGYFRLSTHLYTEHSDFTTFVERCVPLINDRAQARRR